MIIIPFNSEEDARLRELKKFDIPSLETMAQDSEVQRNFFKIESSEDYFESAVAWNNEKPRDYWGFVIEYENKPAGYIHLAKDELENKAIVNAFIGKKSRNKGLCSQAIETIKEFAFQDLHLDCLETRIDPENFASKQVALKNGFEFYDKSNYNLEKDGTEEKYEIYTVFRD